GLRGPHDERDRARVQDGAYEAAVEPRAAHQAVSGVHQDVMVIDGEEAPAEDRGDDADAGGQDDHRQEWPLLERTLDRRHAGTGVPESSASTLTSPNGSSHCAGFHRQRARASSAALVAPSTSPTYFTEPVKLGRQPPATIRRCPVRFAASTAQ